jgi:hypothetical protein
VIDHLEAGGARPLGILLDAGHARIALAKERDRLGRRVGAEPGAFGDSEAAARRQQRAPEA